MVERLSGLDRILFEPYRLGIGVGVEDRHVHGAATRPETTTAHLVRVGFDGYKARQVRRAWVRRRPATGETGEGQVKGPPEEMYRAHLADEPGAKLRQHAACLQQNAPDALRIFGIIGRMLLILFKGS